jgi:hypothetical protein
VLADSAPSPTPTALHIADYVASGFGINDTLKNPQITPSLQSTGTGLEYASKCQDALSTWSKSSFWYGWDDAIVGTSTFASSFTETHRLAGSTKVTSSITLCDGYPRVVGRTTVSTGNLTTSTAAWTNTYTESKFNSAYPTPAPCSIQPDDCNAMSSMYNSRVSSLISRYGQATIQPPVCTITPSSSYSFSTDTANGKTCDNCQIAASTARVMFWPITTRRGGDLCSSPGATITASPTGPPNSFVTEGITITSPTVAISLGYMSRVDGCGTTINHTIIPVHPDQVTSVRGFRALFEHHQFNFADLNYFCMDTNKTMGTIPEGEGDSCYQQVPADAYFGGLNNAVVLDQAPFRNMSKDQMTIWDDYRPQLLPPATLTVAIASLWGNDCNIHPDGVWDPPIALTPEAAIVVPTAPGGGGASKTDSAESNASPINSYQAQPPRQTGIAVPTKPSEGDDGSSSQQHFTALPETGGYGGDGQSGGQQQSGGSQEGSSGGSGSSSGQSSGGSQGSSGSSSGQSNGGSQEASGGSGSSSGQSNGGSQESSGGSGGQSGQSNGGSQESGGDSGSGSGQSNGGSQQSGGGSGSQSGQSSGGSQQSGGGSGSSSGDSGPKDNSQNSDTGNDSGASNQGQGSGVMIHTTIITIGSKTLQATQNQDGAWVVPDSSTTYTVAAGGPAVQVDAATLTAGNHGLVNMHTSVLTIGSKTLTGMQDANGAWIVSDGSTTHTISQGGSAVTVDAATLTAGPDGLVDTHATTTTIGGEIITYSKDSNGAFIIHEGTTTHTVTPGASAFEMDGVTLTAGSGGLSDAHAATTTMIGGQTVTYSKDSNGAYVILDGTTTRTVSPGASAFEMDGVTLTAGSGGLSDVHASKTGSNTRSSGATSTRGSQATSTSGSDSSSSDSDASSAGHNTPRLTVLALAFVALVFCAI